MDDTALALARIADALDKIAENLGRPKPRVRYELVYPTAFGKRYPFLARLIGSYTVRPVAQKVA